MLDPRMKKLANLLVNYSCRLQPGEKILIDSSGAPVEFVSEIVKEVYAVGGYPFVQLGDNRVKRTLVSGMTKELAEKMNEYETVRMKEMDAYIGIRGGNNDMELSDVNEEKKTTYNKFYASPICNLRVDTTKWVILRYPTEGMAQLAKMSTERFEDYFLDVCTMDYAKMSKAMDKLADLMKRTDKVRLIAKDTDLSFSIKGIGAVKCAGECNIPDGEVYSAPVKDSVNGYIHYNAPSIENGFEFKDVRLSFQNGKIVEATANDTAACNAVFDTDEGARYVGEFAIGVNPFVTKPMGDILFDEKISGSIHFTPGCCYDDCDNGNKSAVHWDLVLIMAPEYGGGEIWFDDVLIRKDGRFVLPELLCLNPENLK